MQKKLMLRPTAVPTENLPPEITDAPYIERPDTPENYHENTSSSFVSLDQSDSSTTGVITSSPGIITSTNSNNNNNNNNNTITINNNHTQQEYHNHQEEVKMVDNQFTYHPATPQIATLASNSSVSFQPSTHETLTPLSTVPYQEIQDPAYSVYYDGTEIDSKRLATVLNKDDYSDGTITYVVNFVDY